MDEALDYIKKTGADERSYPYMLPKTIALCIEIKDVSARDANIIKQEALSKGGDASISSSAYSLEDSSDLLLIGSLKALTETAKKLKLQPVKRLRELSEELKKCIDNYLSTPAFIIGERKVEHTAIMGILNVTPDSFYDGGKYNRPELAVERAPQIPRPGADIIDIGGQSTRPGYEHASIEEERQRVIPALRAILENSNVRLPVSIDTSKPEVAEEALKLGAIIINDQEGLHGNERIAHLVAEYNASLILMHNRKVGTEMMFDVLAYLKESISTAERMGVEPERISVDPGIGFGKTAEQNLVIIKNLQELKVLGKSITVGASRKSFIGKVLNREKDERLEGSLAALVSSIINGATIVRVHDVKESALAAKMVDAIIKAKS
jgi:dihydropteroate synthase